MSLEVGKKVPDFSLKGDDGKTFKLSGIKDKVLLVFYPGDGTPVCTTQWNEYKDNAKSFDSVDVQVIGISSNDSSSQKNFKKENDLPFKLLSDVDGDVAKSFDCKDCKKNQKCIYARAHTSARLRQPAAKPIHTNSV